MQVAKIPFDSHREPLATARQIVIERLCHDEFWHQLDSTGEGFAPYVEYVGQGPHAQQQGRAHLVFLAQEVFWQLLVEGLVAPGMDPSNLKLSFFHITEHGRTVLDSVEPSPYDSTGYLTRVHRRVANPDPTVIAYLAESLDTFRKDNRIASAVMLGIAAERVFLLLCESLSGALANPSEKVAFTKILDRFPMKPKLDWVQTKVQQIQKQAPSGFPENASIMLVAIYELNAHAEERIGASSGNTT
jgi:hypothetical protein